MNYSVIRNAAISGPFKFMKVVPDAVYFNTPDGSNQLVIHMDEKYHNAKGNDVLTRLRNEVLGRGRKATPDELIKAAKAYTNQFSSVKHSDDDPDILTDDDVEIIEAPYPENGKAQIPKRCFIYDDEDGYPTDYFEHHGILGMKWGVRRYQNPDGSLTDAGKKRYGLGDPKYQRKHGINETENVMKNLVFMRKGSEIAKDNYKFRKSSGNEKEFKTGEAQAKATENYAKFLKDTYDMFDDMIPKGNGKLTGESREKYISYLLNQTVEHLNSPAMQGYISEGTKILYKIDTSRGLNDIDFKLEFEYPDQRKIK